MKNTIMKSTLFLGAALLMGVAAQAQTNKFSIPFAFEANGKTLPSGNYAVEPVAGIAATYAMRNLDTHAGVLLSGHMAMPSQNPAEAKLVFHARPDGYYLTEVWDGRMGREVSGPRGKNSVLASTKVVLGATK